MTAKDEAAWARAVLWPERAVGRRPAGAMLGAHIAHSAAPRRCTGARVLCKAVGVRRPRAAAGPVPSVAPVQAVTDCSPAGDFGTGRVRAVMAYTLVSCSLTDVRILSDMYMYPISFGWDTRRRELCVYHKFACCMLYDEATIT